MTMTARRCAGRARYESKELRFSEGGIDGLHKVPPSGLYLPVMLVNQDQYAVLRQSGRNDQAIRPLYIGPWGLRALEVFEREASRLRQGRVSFFDQGGKLIRTMSGPRLRTRW